MALKKVCDVCGKDISPKESLSVKLPNITDVCMECGDCLYMTVELKKKGEGFKEILEDYFYLVFPEKKGD